MCVGAPRSTTKRRTIGIVSIFTIEQEQCSSSAPLRLPSFLLTSAVQYICFSMTTRASHIQHRKYHTSMISTRCCHHLLSNSSASDQTHLVHIARFRRLLEPVDFTCQCTDVCEERNYDVCDSRSQACAQSVRTSCSATAAAIGVEFSAGN